MSESARLPVRPTARVVETGSSHLRNGTEGSNSGQDSVPNPGSHRTHRRIGARSLRRLDTQLSARDRDILRSVAALKLLSARQVERLHFYEAPSSGSHLTRARTGRRVLERLVRDGLLARLNRRIGGLRSGSASYVYCLAPTGQRLVKPSGARARVREPTAAFIDHTLAVADAWVEVTEAGRAGGFDVLHMEGEPECWRRFTSLGGVAQTLKPDLFVSLGVSDLELRWFIELDLNTHHSPAVQRKANQYLAYFKSGIEQTREGVFPRVLWVAEEEGRVKRLRDAVRRVGRVADIFAFTARENLLKTLEGVRP